MTSTESFPPAAAERRVVALVELALEARIAAQSNAVVVCHDKGCDLIRPPGGRGMPTVLKAALEAGCTKVISFDLTIARSKRVRTPHLLDL